MILGKWDTSSGAATLKSAPVLRTLPDGGGRASEEDGATSIDAATPGNGGDRRGTLVGVAVSPIAKFESSEGTDDTMTPGGVAYPVV